jgi:hypothetical protein
LSCQKYRTFLLKFSMGKEITLLEPVRIQEEVSKREEASA